MPGRGWQSGFAREDGVFVCDNGADAQAQRGVSQTVVLNQEKPEPIIATAWSKAEGVGGARDSDYSLYLDLRYTDGTPLWGQVDSWTVGTHDWEKAQVIVFPEKPVASVSFYMLLRGHAGKAWFRDPRAEEWSAAFSSMACPSSRRGRRRRDSRSATWRPRRISSPSSEVPWTSSSTAARRRAATPPSST